VVAALATDQPALPRDSLIAEAEHEGVLLTIFESVEELLSQAIGWSLMSAEGVLSEFPRLFLARL
jgi:hypothetical protein